MISECFMTNKGILLSKFKLSGEHLLGEIPDNTVILLEIFDFSRQYNSSMFLNMPIK